MSDTSQLAIRGGEPVRSPLKSWPRWPVVPERAVDLVAEVVRSGKWGGDGPRERQLADTFAVFSGARYCSPVANGTVAIQLALEALDIGAYDEVIVPGLTWQATAAACIDVNAVPVLVDVDPETFCLDAQQAEAAITARTRAIIVTHLYGAMADMDTIIALARRHNLKLIEDCAHQHGSQWRGKGVGALGDVGAFSMQQSKVLPTGEGGLNLTDDWTLYQRLVALRNCGRLLRPTSPAVQSGNYRLTELQAALALAFLEHLEEQVDRRDATAQYLNRQLAEVPGICPMQRHAQVTRQSYYCFTFRYEPASWEGVPSRVFRKALAAEVGLGVGTTYEPLNDCPLYRPHTKRRHSLNDDYWQAIDPARFQLPACERAYRDAMVIGHSFLLAGREDMDAVACAVRKLYDRRADLLAIE